MILALIGSESCLAHLQAAILFLAEPIITPVWKSQRQSPSFFVSFCDFTQHPTQYYATPASLMAYLVRMRTNRHPYLMYCTYSRKSALLYASLGVYWPSSVDGRGFVRPTLSSSSQRLRIEFASTRTEDCRTRRPRWPSQRLSCQPAVG